MFRKTMTALATVAALATPLAAVAEPAPHPAAAAPARVVQPAHAAPAPAAQPVRAPARVAAPAPVPAAPAAAPAAPHGNGDLIVAAAALAVLGGIVAHGK